MLLDVIIIAQRDGLFIVWKKAICSGKVLCYLLRRGIWFFLFTLYYCILSFFSYNTVSNKAGGYSWMWVPLTQTLTIPVECVLIYRGDSTALSYSLLMILIIVQSLIIAPSYSHLNESLTWLYTLKTNALAQQQKWKQQFASIFFELCQLLMKLCSINKQYWVRGICFSSSIKDIFYSNYQLLNKL